MSYVEYDSREQWLAARKAVITSTDVGQIVGVSKWGNALKVFAEKTNPEFDDIDNEQMILGRCLQQGIATAYAIVRAKRGDGNPKIQHVPNYALYISDERAHAASMDCFQIMEGIEGWDDGAYPLEIKSTGAYPDEPYDEWMTQVQWQMYITKSQRATIAASCGGDDLRYWDIDRDEDLIQPLVTAADVFIEQYLIPAVPPMPDGTEHSRAALRQIYKQSDGTEVTLGMEHLDAVLELDGFKEQLKAVEAEIHQREHFIMSKMGNAEVAYLPNGRKITWKTSERSGYTVKPTTVRRFVIGKDPQQKKGA